MRMKDIELNCATISWSLYLPSETYAMRRRRPILALLLALLLVLMQQGAQLHAIGHDRDRLSRADDTGLQAPVVDASCAMCALFAGGATAVVSDVVSHAVPVVDASVLRYATSSLAVASPSPYQSRAPPPTL